MFMSLPVSHADSPSSIIDSAAPTPPRGRTLKRKADLFVKALKTEKQPSQGRVKRRRTEEIETMSGRDPGDDPNTARYPSMNRSQSHSHSRISQSPLTNRPILEPTPPSTLHSRSRSRPRSPVRTTIRAMERGTPSVRLQLSTTSRQSAPLPATISRLITSLSQHAARSVPVSLSATLEAHNPLLFAQVADSAFSDERLYDGLGDAQVWESVRSIERRAEKCYRRHADESEWCLVVLAVLKLACQVTDTLDDSAADFTLGAHPVYTQSIEERFLPRILSRGGSEEEFVNKKTDFVLAVDDESSTHVDANPERLWLSPMKDAFTTTLPLLCALEVKRLDGNEEEAQLQLMVWQTAMLNHLHYLRRCGHADGDADCESGAQLPPVVGWTVTNHYWKLYIAWKQADGSIIVMRPFTLATAASNTGTENVASIFVLLKVFTKLISWFRTEYYPAYSTLLRAAVQRQDEGGD